MECRWGTETKRPLLEDKTVFLVYMHLEGAQTSALITDLIALFTPGWAMPGPSGRSPSRCPGSSRRVLGEGHALTLPAATCCSRNTVSSAQEAWGRGGYGPPPVTRSHLPPWSSRLWERWGRKRLTSFHWAVDRPTASGNRRSRGVF